MIRNNSVIQTSFYKEHEVIIKKILQQMQTVEFAAQYTPGQQEAEFLLACFKDFYRRVLMFNKTFPYTTLEDQLYYIKTVFYSLFDFLRKEEILSSKLSYSFYDLLQFAFFALPIIHGDIESKLSAKDLRSDIKKAVCYGMASQIVPKDKALTYFRPGRRFSLRMYYKYLMSLEAREVLKSSTKKRPIDKKDDYIQSLQQELASLKEKFSFILTNYGVPEDEQHRILGTDPHPSSE